MTDNEEKRPFSEIDPKAEAAIMIIMAALRKSTNDATHYLAMIIRQGIKDSEHAQEEAESTMAISQAMLEAGMAKGAGRGKIAIAALSLASVVVEDLIKELFPQLYKEPNQ